MTEKLLRTLIARAVALDRQIREKTDLLAALKAEFIEAAVTCEPTPTRSGRRRWTATGHDGSVVHVTFPAPKVRFESAPCNEPSKRPAR